MSDIVSVDPARRFKVVPVIIRSGKALSEPLGGPPPAGTPGPLDLTGYILHAINMPGAFDGTAITFLAADKNVRDTAGVPLLQSVFDSGGTEVSVTVAVSRYVVLTAAHRDALAGVNHLQLRSGTAGGPQTQSADRILQLVLMVALL